MRVLIFSTAYYPFVGGAEVAIKEITDRLPDYEFDLITAKLKPGLAVVEHIDNVTVHRLGLGNFLDKLWLAKFGGWKAWWMSRENRYDIGWSMMASYGGLAAWWFKVLCPRIPLVLTLQEGDDISARKFGLVALGWRLVLSKADRVTVISKYLGNLARKHGYGGEIDLVPNGVDVEKFKNQKSKIKVGEEITLITASRLVEKNAVGDIIEGLKFLPENVKLLVAGTGPLEKSLKFTVESLQLRNRVTFLGYISHDGLPKYLHTSDIFVRPSLSEGLGNSFLEAMAAGLPVIATPVGGIIDFLKDPSTSSGSQATGWFCRPNDPKSIAETVQKILANKTETQRVIENAKKMVETRYRWETIAASMKKVFEKAV